MSSPAGPWNGPGYKVEGPPGLEVGAASAPIGASML